MTTKESVIEVVQSIVLEVLPDLTPSDVQMDRSLKDLGANSVDRAEVAMLAMQRLNLRIPMPEFAGVANLGALVTLLYEHATGKLGGARAR